MSKQYCQWFDGDDDGDEYGADAPIGMGA